MDILSPLIDRPICSNAIPILADFISQYDSTGRSVPLNSPDNIRTAAQLSQTFAAYLSTTAAQNIADKTAALLDIDIIDPDIIKLNTQCLSIIKIFTRAQEPSILLGCYDESFLQAMISLSTGISILFNAYVQESAPNTDNTAKFAQLLLLRLEIVRLLQNLTIINLDTVQGLFLASNTIDGTNNTPLLIHSFIQLLSSAYLSATTVNQSTIQAILAAAPSLTIHSILGIVETQHILRICSFLISQITGAKAFAKAGLIGAIYLVIHKVTHTPVGPENVDGKLIHPLLFTPNTSVFGLSEDILTINSNEKTQPIHISFRIAIGDLLRALHIFGMQDHSDEYVAFFHTQALGSTPELENITDSNISFYDFVETIFYLLSLGLTSENVPAAISAPVDKIVNTEYLFVNYLINIVDEETQDRTTYGYNKEQIALLDSLNATLLSKNDEPFSPTAPIFFNKDNTTILHMKHAIIKVLARLPLQLAPFLYLHKRALAYIWDLFVKCIDTYVSPTSLNPLLQIPQCSYSYNEQVTELVPAIEGLLSVLSASFTLEKQAKDQIPPELAELYDAIGLSTLAQVVKSLLFGPYADPEYKIDSNPNFVMVDECDVGGDQEEDDVCGDFEAFAQNFEGINDDNEEDESRMSVGSFLRSLPSPTPENGGKSGKKVVMKKSDQPMIPAGGLSERLLDDADNTSLRARVLLMMLFNQNSDLALLIQELMWFVAYQDTQEYIRLCGFGRAIGLLANKGLPGFAAFAQNALNLDQLIPDAKK